MANYSTCKKCGKELSSDAVAIFKKLVNRSADEFLCIECLAEFFNCEPEKIYALIKYYRESGECTLFR